MPIVLSVVIAIDTSMTVMGYTPGRTSGYIAMATDLGHASYARVVSLSIKVVLVLPIISACSSSLSRSSCATVVEVVIQFQQYVFLSMRDCLAFLTEDKIRLPSVSMSV